MIGWIYQQKYHEYDIALEYLNLGVAELEDNTECPEMAWISIPLCWVVHDQGHYEKAMEIAQRGLRIVEDTEHYFETVELCRYLANLYLNNRRDSSKAYEYARKALDAAQKSGNLDLMGRASIQLGHAYALKDEYDAAVELVKESIEIAKKTGKVFFLGQGYYVLGGIYLARQDWDKAIETFGCCLEIPDHPDRVRDLQHLARSYAEKGDDETAIRLFRESMEIAGETGDDKHLRWYRALSDIYVKREDWDRAVEYLECSLKIPNHPDRAQLLSRLAYIYMRKENAAKAIEYSKKVLESAETANIILGLSVMEESLVLAGRQEEFTAYCSKLREEKAEALRDMKLNQWYLEPAEVSGIFAQTTFVDEFDGPELGSEWEWVNTKGDSSYSFAKEGNWLEIHAASGSHLWSGFHAPRLLQKVSGDFTVEVKMKASSDELPSVGGLLVWVDRDNLIRFESGLLLENGVTFISRICSEYDCFGRGRLPSDILYLRLERTGDVFSAYCSDDGKNWLTCGYMDFPAEDPIKVGIHAISYSGLRGGNMDTATQFGSFRVLKRASQI
jgi:tetratricopeptide (TPR) repeat protein/regulation of enolase protein 1 (concanavalin A-like superfamily)